MKTIIRRLHRLESVAAIVAKGPSIAEVILERRRRRLEASGQTVESSPPIDYTGCRTIADHILRAREACMKRDLAKGRAQ
jgi:predicted nucleic acid-binding OB-fold protein